MTNTFTLDALRDDIVSKFAPTKVELSDGSKVELKSLLKLGEKDREMVLKVFEDIKEIEQPEDGDDLELVEEYSQAVCEQVARIFRVATSAPRKLLAELDHEDPEIKAHLHIAVLNKWIRGTQLGEAGSSPA